LTGGTGVCLFAKRLEDGASCWPNIQDGVMHLTAAQISALLEGLDWRRIHAARQTTVPTQPS
jgi:transposase